MVDPPTILHPRPPVRRRNVERSLVCTVGPPCCVCHCARKRQECRRAALHPAPFLCLTGGNSRRNGKHEERNWAQSRAERISCFFQPHKCAHGRNHPEDDATCVQHGYLEYTRHNLPKNERHSVGRRRHLEGSVVGVYAACRETAEIPCTIMEPLRGNGREASEQRRVPASSKK